MNQGVWICIILVPGFLIFGILFAVFKEKSVKFVAGFNFFSEEEQKKYDKAYIARDLRNSFFIWSAVMLAGAILSLLITPYSAIAAYIIWGVLFFRDLHIDLHKAFEKYLLK